MLVARNLRLWPWPWLLALGCGACGPALPEQALILDTRILGIRPVPLVAAQEPPQQPAPASFSAGDVARIEALVVDPDGPIDPDGIDVLWFACPLAPTLPLFSCLSAAIPLDLEAIPSCPVAGATDTEAETVPLPAPCMLSRDLSPDWSLPAVAEAASGASVELTLVLAEGNRTASECARALVRGDYDTPDGCEYATGELGLTRPGLVQELNTHPRVGTITATLQAGSGEELGVVLLEDGDSLSLGSSDRVEFMASPPEADAQPFLVSVNGAEPDREAFETLSAQWLSTAGSFRGGAFGGGGGGGGGGAFGDSLQTTWTPDTALAATIYVLVRDDRRGMSWATIQVTP